MINESRESFTEWLVKTYRELHEELFDAEGKFKMERMLSGEMLCYAIETCGSSWKVEPRTIEVISHGGFSQERARTLAKSIGL